MPPCSVDIYIIDDVVRREKELRKSVCVRLPF